MPNPLAQLSQAGVSIWLDDLSRDRIQSGALRSLIANRHVSGVTTNPTIFAAALAKGEAYREQVAELAAQGLGPDRAIFEITTDDVAAACDVFAEVFQETKGVDGRVSIEVEPKLANDAPATTKQAKELFERVNRPNVMIKIPATKKGLGAITETLGAGISVNVTLIFSLDRYRDVIHAYFAGLELAEKNGHRLSEIHSVASFFVSRVDSEIDKRLDQIGTEGALALKGKAAVANARLAYQLFEQEFASDQFKALSAKGANLQRPLMASTGVKDPALPDTMYVTDLVATDLVNTMPEKTMEAVYDHGQIAGDSIRPNYDGAKRIMADLKAAGVDYDDVVELLEREGVAKFIASWDELVATVSAALESSR